ncbi:MAG: hypothetical protein ABSH25_15845 [Syntrophorhabdales bacterium]|jgi:hypothetical protein
MENRGGSIAWYREKDARKLLSLDFSIGLLSHGKAYMGKDVDILKKLAFGA